jgi:membrane-bound metal-dependent hydrolase YbcI (DUF457 family)
MNRGGHIGFTLTILSSTLYALNLASWSYLWLALLSAFFSTLPDLDLRVGAKHRRYTHSVFTALAASTSMGLLTQHLGLSFTLGFAPCMMGILCHIAGDLLTHMSFPPLWPLSDKCVSLKLFRSDSRAANTLLLALGILASTLLAHKAAA